MSAAPTGLRDLAERLAEAFFAEACAQLVNHPDPHGDPRIQAAARRHGKQIADALDQAWRDWLAEPKESNP